MLIKMLLPELLDIIINYAEDRATIRCVCQRWSKLRPIWKNNRYVTGEIDPSDAKPATMFLANSGKTWTYVQYPFVLHHPKLLFDFNHMEKLYPVDKIIVDSSNVIYGYLNNQMKFSFNENYGLSLFHIFRNHEITDRYEINQISIHKTSYLHNVYENGVVVRQASQNQTREIADIGNLAPELRYPVYHEYLDINMPGVPALVNYTQFNI